ncbi:MAG: rRNA maturation RNase YbeY [Candidatus Omnitrophica bacterium]|nr:rRNA maturation RNase YbeY [Candidatus Omnitrophota bacterium]
MGENQGDISIVFVSPQRMKLLNARHLNHHYSTDILTFDYRQGADGFLIAEIVICPSVAKHNAILFGKSVAQEIALYVVHGLLHLMGFDDHSPQKTALMRKKEAEVISYLFTRGG